MLLRGRDHPQVTRQTMEKTCIIRFSFEVFLEDDEVLKVRAVYLSKLSLKYGFLQNWNWKKKKRIAMDCYKVQFKTGDKILGNTSDEKLKNTYYLFESGSTIVNVEVILSNEYCQLGAEASAMTGILALEIASGVKVRDKFETSLGDPDPICKIYSNFFKIMEWVISFCLMLFITWMIYRWSLDHKAVYRSFSIDSSKITAVCAGIFAYFGIPKINSVVSLKPQHNYLRRLHSQIQYPEYYFDQYLIKALQNWIMIIFLIICSIAVFTVKHEYRTLQLEIEGLGQTVVLGPKVSATRPRSTEECSKRSTAEFASAELIEDEQTRAKVSDLFKANVSELYSDVLRYLEKVRSSSQKSKPQRIYSRDIDTTCLYVKSDLPNDKKYRYCIADLKIDSERVIIDPYSFYTGDRKFTFAKKFPVPRDEAEFKHADPAIKAYALMRGKFRREWKMHIFQHERSDCKFMIANDQQKPEIFPYTYTNFLTGELQGLGLEHGFNLAGESWSNRDISSIFFKIDVDYTKQPIGEEFSGKKDHSWQAFRVLDVLLEDIFQIMSLFNKKDVNIPPDIAAKVPAFYITTLIPANTIKLQTSIVKVWFGLEHFARMRDAKPANEQSKKFIETDTDRLIGKLSEFLNNDFGKIDCKLYKFKDNNVEQNFCNNTRRIYSDFLVMEL